MFGLLAFRVLEAPDSGLRVEVLGLGFTAVEGLESRVEGFGRGVEGLGFTALCLGLRVFGFGVEGLGV